MISWASFTAFWHFYERSLFFDAGPESCICLALLAAV